MHRIDARASLRDETRAEEQSGKWNELLCHDTCLSLPSPTLFAANPSTATIFLFLQRTTISRGDVYQTLQRIKLVTAIVVTFNVLRTGLLSKMNSRDDYWDVLGLRILYSVDDRHS